MEKAVGTVRKTAFSNSFTRMLRSPADATASLIRKDKLVQKEDTSAIFQRAKDATRISRKRDI
jgi:hypothetical protein